MSFKGEIEAKCPQGCEPFATEVWSFIRGDQNPELRDAVLWRECNLILCSACDRPFFPEASYVYFEPRADLLAFVFPESYSARQDYWRGKMLEDFQTIKENLKGEISLVHEPAIFFGPEGLAQLLEQEDFQGEEREVMEHYAKELGLSLYSVSPSYARREFVPRSLPYAGTGQPTLESVLEGIERLLAANDALASYEVFLKRLKADPQAVLPPAAGLAAD